MKSTLNNTKIPLVDLKAQYQSIKDEVDAAITDCVENTQFIQGSRVDTFEKNFAAFCSITRDQTETELFCASCANGTDALEIALKAFDVKAGDEIITVSHSFFATAEAIITLGATPKFVDIHTNTMLMNENLIEKEITSKTKGIIAVHLYGQPCNMDLINQIAEKYNLFVIEDAAQAHGAYWGNERVGMLGDAACFSFFPGKNLGAYGDGGAIVSKNIDFITKAKQIACHGRAKKEKYLHDLFGRNSRLDALQATLLDIKLKYLDTWNEKRAAIASHYLEFLAGSGFVLPQVHPKAISSWHLFVIRLKSSSHCLPLVQKMKELGPTLGRHYPVPIHLQPAYLKSSFKKYNLPHTELTAETLLSLPIYPELTIDQIKNISSLLKECYLELLG